MTLSSLFTWNSKNNVCSVWLMDFELGPLTELGTYSLNSLFFTNAHMQREFPNNHAPLFNCYLNLWILGFHALFHKQQVSVTMSYHGHSSHHHNSRDIQRFQGWQMLLSWWIALTQNTFDSAEEHLVCRQLYYVLLVAHWPQRYTVYYVYL